MPLPTTSLSLTASRCSPSRRAAGSRAVAMRELDLEREGGRVRGRWWRSEEEEEEDSWLRAGRRSIVSDRRDLGIWRRREENAATLCIRNTERNP